MQDLAKEIGDTLKNVEAHVERLRRQHAQRQGYTERMADANSSFSLFGVDDDYLLAHYRANMAVFEEYFPDIHKVMAEYQPSRYHIDVSDNLPNIRDTETGALVYQDPAYLMALLQYQDFVDNPQCADTTVDNNKDNVAGFIHSEYLNKLLARMHQLMADNEGTRILPTQLGELLVFGTGLGFHLEFLVVNHPIMHLYVIEPDLDLFYASLFTCAWFYILPILDQRGSSLHLCLGTDSEEFFDKYAAETSVRGRYNVARSYGYIHYHTDGTNKALAEYKARYFELVHGWGFYDDAAMSIAHQGENLDAGLPFVKKYRQATSKIRQTPVIICANGPSLDHLASFVRDHQHNAIIVSCGTAIRALHRYGIEPDVHCEQERTYPIAGLLDAVGDAEYLRRRVLFAPGTVHPEVFTKFKSAIMAPKYWEASSFALMADPEFAKDHVEALFINPTVANTALYMANALGFQQIYLVGVDLGYKPEGHHHSKASIYYSDDGQETGIYNRSSKHVTAGNFGGEIYSDSFFTSSRLCLERLIKRNPDLRVYNLNDGAAIKGTIPCQAADVILPLAVDKDVILAKTIALNVDEQPSSVYAQAYWDKVAPQHFAQLCMDVLDILQPPTNSRRQGSELMVEVHERLRDEARQGRKYLYAMLEGSMLYFQSMLVRVLFSPVADEVAVAWFNELKSIYAEFISALPEHYAVHYRKPNGTTFKEWCEKMECSLLVGGL